MPSPLAELQMRRASRVRLIQRHRFYPNARRLHESSSHRSAFSGAIFFNTRRTTEVSTG
jgi:hypothetical protein